MGCGAKEGAVATLEKLGGRIYRDEQGDVTTVNLSRSITNDAEMRHLQKLTNLEFLSLGRIQITDTGLVHLKGLINLQRLDLYGCENITDSGLEHLKGLMDLKTLNLTLCENITDAGLVHLNGMTKLKTLFLPDQITNTAMMDLHKALPDLNIN